jgi:hypothetical protein
MVKGVLDPAEMKEIEESKTPDTAARQKIDKSDPDITKHLDFTQKDKQLLKQMGIKADDAPVNQNKNPWEKDIQEEHGKAFNETATGRLAIRVISRGVFGAAFFALGGHIASRHMEGYDPDKSFREIWEEVKKGKEVLKDVPGYKTTHPWLQLCAKLIDMTAGKAISGTVKTLGFGEEVAKEAVTFRPFRSYFVGEGATAKKIQGYSLGHESVMRTFDFAMASIGDSFAREYLVALIDPNVKLSWIKREKLVDEQGKVHEKKSIDFPKAVKAFGAMVWDIFSYRQMEDWAVAVPYVYQIRAQRHLLNKISPGFEYDSDWTTNGGSFKVSPKYFNKEEAGHAAPLESGKLVFKGNYNMEGILDLTFRFTGYNIGTLMFREGYHALGDGIKKWWDTGKTPDIHVPTTVSGAIHGVTDSVYSTTKYLLRSIVKGSIYMIPSAFTFGLLRASQYKDLGLAICDEEKPAGKAPYIDQHTPYGPAHFLAVDPAYEAKLKEMSIPLNASGKPIEKLSELARKDPNRVLLNLGIRRVYVNASGAEFGKFSQEYHHQVSDPSRGMSPEPEVRSHVFTYDKERLEFFKEWKSGQLVPNNSLKNPFRLKRYVEGEAVVKEKPFDAYAISNTWYDPTTNFIGRISERFTNYTTHAISSVGKYHDENVLLKNKFAGLTKSQQDKLIEHRVNSLKSISRTAGMAAFAYTPYMYMKGELSKKWDTPRMDVGIDRSIDGLFHANVSEFKAGIGEVCKAINNERFDDPEREKEVQKRMKVDGVIGDDTSPVVHVEIPDGYSYIKNISKRETVAPTQKIASDFPTQSLQSIIAQKLSEPRKAWSEQSKESASKEQNAPTTRNVN